MENLLNINDEVVTALDRVEKAQFIVSDIQDEAFGGYIAPDMETYKDSVSTRYSVRLEMVQDYLRMVGDQLSRIYDMVPAQKSVAV